jgi:pantothenate kinase-related protein Tda10
VWNDVVLRVRLNTPGRADGVAGLGVNGQYREYDKMVWRLDGATNITTVSRWRRTVELRLQCQHGSVGTVQDAWAR